MNKTYLVAIDPWAMILPSAVYQKLIEKFHPHVMKVEDVQKAARAMSPREKAATLAKVREVMAGYKAVEEVLAARK